MADPAAGSAREGGEGTLRSLLELATEGGLAVDAARRYPLTDADGDLLGLAGPVSAPSRAAGLVDAARWSSGRDVTDARRELAALVDLAPVGIFRTDAAGRVLVVNARWCEISGASDEEALGTGWTHAVHPDDRGPVLETWAAAVAEQREIVRGFRFLRADGTTRTVVVHAIPLRDDDGTLTGFLGTITDITPLESARAALRAREAQAARIVETSPVGIGVCRVDGTFLSTNPALCTLLGRREEELLSLRYQDVSATDEWEREQPMLAELLAGQREDVSVAKRVLRPDGSERQATLVVTRLDGADGTPVFVGQLSDVTEQRALEAALATRANRDPLTGLMNRHAFLEQFGKALARTERTCERVAILFLDLDHFKDVNDTLGHHVGDELLCQVAERLHASVRGGDTIGRLGGDEFVVLCEPVHEPVDAHTVAERITANMRLPFVIGSSTVHVTVSVGVRVAERGDTDPSRLLRDADAAAYHAKHAGRAQWSSFGEHLRTETDTRLALERDLREAYADGSLETRYQPLVSVASGRIVALEAVASWQHPTRGVLDGEVLFDTADRIRLTSAITDLVLGQIAEAHRQWWPQLSVHVNLPARELRDDALGARLLASLRELGLPAEQVCWEIAEPDLVRHLHQLGPHLVQLRAAGCRVAVDRFGSGASALAALRHLPVDAVKLDEEFLADIGRDRASTGIVAAVTHLAHSLRLQVVATGVETPVQVAALVNLDCDLLQGDAFARSAAAGPLPALRSLAVGRLGVRA
jgi:diguanylate cyclase (GGDEF)-like protein/PAS domain S-box-containing protein